VLTMIKIFDDDDPLVLNGTYDTEGYKPGERAREAKANARQLALSRKDSTMRFFDSDRVGAYLDAVGLRLEKTKDGEHKVIDLTLRVQPFTPELAAALHPEVRALLFTLGDGSPKPLLKAVDLRLPALSKQHLDVHLLPEDSDAQITLLSAEISSPRARTEKGVDGYAFIFYATIGPVGRDELEYVTNWYTQQRFVTFREAQPSLALEEDDSEPDEDEAKPRRGRRARQEASV